jgi:hypothetical protein
MLVCNARDPNANVANDEVKDVELTVGVFETAPVSAMLMFSATKGDKATTTEWVPAKDGGVLAFTYDRAPFKLAGAVELPTGQFSYFINNNASQHASRFYGRCSVVGADGRQFS